MPGGQVDPIQACPVQIPKGFRVQDNPRIALGYNATLVEEDQSVRILSGQAEVMHRRDDNEPVLDSERIDQLQHLLLVSDVKGTRRLVKHQNGSLLRQGARDHGPLAFAAAQVENLTLRKATKVESVHQFLDHLPILAAWTGQKAEMGCPAEHDVVGGGHAKRKDRTLRNDGDEPTEGAPRLSADRVPMHRHLAADDHTTRRPERTRHYAKRRAFSRPVRPEQHNPFSCPHVKRQVGQDGRVAESQAKRPTSKDDSPRRRVPIGRAGGEARLSSSNTRTGNTDRYHACLRC